MTNDRRLAHGRRRSVLFRHGVRLGHRVGGYLPPTRRRGRDNFAPLVSAALSPHRRRYHHHRPPTYDCRRQRLQLPPPPLFPVAAFHDVCPPRHRRRATVTVRQCTLDVRARCSAAEVSRRVPTCVPRTSVFLSPADSRQSRVFARPLRRRKCQSPPRSRRRRRRHNNNNTVVDDESRDSRCHDPRTPVKRNRAVRPTREEPRVRETASGRDDDVQPGGTGNRRFRPVGRDHRREVHGKSDRQVSTSYVTAYEPPRVSVRARVLIQSTVDKCQ